MPITPYNAPIQYEYKPLNLSSFAVPLAKMQEDFDVATAKVDEADFDLAHLSYGSDPEKAKKLKEANDEEIRKKMNDIEDFKKKIRDENDPEKKKKLEDDLEAARRKLRELENARKKLKENFPGHISVVNGDVEKRLAALGVLN
jgi:septal ring factor EnvC (AmiA/AmiB activator)